VGAGIELAPGVAREQRPRRGTALGLGLLLALYGNAFSIADGVSQLSLGGTIGGGLLGLGSLLAGARGGRSELAAFGLRRGGLVPSLIGGLMLGLALGLPGALYFLRPDLAPVAVRYEPLRASSPAVFLALVLVRLPLATALAEELAFRGLLQARLRAAFGAWSAILIGSLAFTAWHLVVSFTTLQSTNLAWDPGAAALAYLGQNLAVFVGGLFFAILRERSGNLAGPILAHWLTDALLMGGLYLQ
jgi:membrane protease YdiL (CAAX protease family)